jgi:hypothetical protein
LKKTARNFGKPGRIRSQKKITNRTRQATTPTQGTSRQARKDDRRYDGDVRRLPVKQVQHQRDVERREEQTRHRVPRHGPARRAGAEPSRRRIMNRPSAVRPKKVISTHITELRISRNLRVTARTSANVPCSSAYRRDDKGNGIEVAVFGTDDKPCLDKLGVRRWTNRFNAQGKQIERAFFGMDHTVVIFR